MLVNLDEAEIGLFYKPFFKDEEDVIVECIAEATFRRDKIGTEIVFKQDTLLYEV
ncbi:MAG: hypothetical protein GQ570_08415 [Helicobacteraceae bacterium]|nr:hypothetical protein [Helicobacteraceae bacterium]